MVQTQQNDILGGQAQLNKLSFKEINCLCCRQFYLLAQRCYKRRGRRLEPDRLHQVFWLLLVIAVDC